MTNKEKFLKLVKNASKSNWLEEAKFRQANRHQLKINVKFAIKLFKYFDAFNNYKYTIQDLAKDTIYTEEEIDSIRRGKLHGIDMDKFLLDITSILDRLFKENLDKRLSELNNIKDNWYEGQEKSISKDLLSIFRELVLTYYNVLLPFPRIFPTTEGYIQLEWENTVKTKCYLLEISNNLEGEWLDISNNQEIDVESIILDLNLESSWKFINNKIKEL